MTSIKQKQQYKRHVCTDKIVWNKQWWSWSEQCHQSGKDDNDKASNKQHQWVSRRELISGTRLHYPLRHAQQSYCQGLAPSSLAMVKCFTGLEALNCEMKDQFN